MFHATTILAYKGKNKAVIGGDGQVSFGNTVLKGNATKIRTLYKGQILAGFAGSTADAFNLFDMFEAHLETCKGDLLKSVIAFSKEWRKDKYLRRLEAMMIVLNKEKIFILSGNGDVVGHSEIGRKVMEDFFLAVQDIAIMEKRLQLEERNFIMILNKKK